VEVGDFTIVHASPRSPVWEYVMDVEVARENMREFETPFCLVGHTHYPCVFSLADEEEGDVQLSVHLPDRPFDLKTKSIINPGSVGQPRDHNPKASYLIHDDAEALPWTYHRVAYDVDAVQRRIIMAGLPMRHASRLREGW
jgi:diadenosine tetraphosphatase ApaH/serine/threonine PP2A family protein phosphatase